MKNIKKIEQATNRQNVQRHHGTVWLHYTVTSKSFLLTDNRGLEGNKCSLFDFIILLPLNFHKRSTPLSSLDCHYFTTSFKKKDHYFGHNKLIIIFIYYYFCRLLVV